MVTNRRCRRGVAVAALTKVCGWPGNWLDSCLRIRYYDAVNTSPCFNVKTDGEGVLGNSSYERSGRLAVLATGLKRGKR